MSVQSSRRAQPRWRKRSRSLVVVEAARCELERVLLARSYAEEINQERHDRRLERESCRKAYR